MKKTIYDKEYIKIVTKLKEARLEADLGQIEVAKKLGRTQSYISKVEAGQLRLDILQIKQFAKIYKKSLDYFL